MADILSDDQLKSLKSRRKRFTDEQIETALKYMIDNPTCTLQEAAKHFDMTAQTLGQRRDLLIAKRAQSKAPAPAPEAATSVEATPAAAKKPPVKAASKK